MQVVKNHNSEYPIGILWNMGNKYAREMMLKIAIMEDVLQVKILDLGKDYEQFVLDCYEGDEEAYDGGYIYEKIKKIADKYNKYKFKIFGSRARGDYRSNSDIDIAIEGNIDKKDKFNIVNEFDMIDMVYTMDIVFIEDITKKEFLDSILKEGINL